MARREECRFSGCGGGWFGGLCWVGFFVGLVVWLTLAPFEHMFAPCKVPRRFAKWPKGSRLLLFDETDFSATLAVKFGLGLALRKGGA